MNKIGLIFEIIVVSLIASLDGNSQSIKETINQHIVNGEYESIEGVWEGTYRGSLYLEAKLINESSLMKVVVSFYKEGNIIKGSETDNPNESSIKLVKGATLGSFEWLFPANTVCTNVTAAGKQTDQLSLVLIYECKTVDKNGISTSIFQEYNLRKQYPLNNDFETIKEREIERRKEEIENAPRTGTGFALSSDGFIVTCYHVVKKAKSIKVKGLSGDFNHSYKADVIQEDESNDLAIIKINDYEFKSFGTIPFKIKNYASDVGEDIFVLGYPLTATMGDEVKLTTGIISWKIRCN